VKTTLILSSLLVIAVLSLAFGLSRHHSQTPARPFTMTSTETVIPTDGSKPWVRNIHTRYVKSDGSFKDIGQQFNPDGSPNGGGELYGIPDVGVFGRSQGHEDLTFRSGKHGGSHGLDETVVRADTARFLGERYVLGYKCLGIKTTPETELWVSTDFDIPLLQIASSERVKYVTEATKIVVGEPQFDGVLPTYNIHYESFENSISDQSDSKIAEEMRQIEALTKVKIQNLQARH
jgi:hypothetical protein